ncbi:hypothetical protein AB1Y20_014709 [Prymnesium parvum]|uniref:Uncharacterized protein n=1 Tax=Prymnesium parvum TaxID=97485 RepID=A0AB34ICW2_PRYPA
MAALLAADGAADDADDACVARGAGPTRKRRGLGRTHFHQLGAARLSLRAAALRFTAAAAAVAALALASAALVAIGPELPRLAPPPPPRLATPAAAAAPRPTPPPPPPPPPLPPPPPPAPHEPPRASPPPSPTPRRPPGVTYLQSLNARFRGGHAANAVEHAGVLVHMLDDLRLSLEQPWLPCSSPSLWCYKFSDRCSASLINQRLPYVFARKETVGVVLSPHLAPLLCSFFVDGGTMLPDKTCDAPGVAADCVPGCWKGEPNWCDGREKVWDCAWRPASLAMMLRHHEQRVGREPWRFGALTYNEVVLSTARWGERLPALIEAFFFLSDRPGEEEKARSIQRRFVAYFPQSEAPLLELDLSNPTSPFLPADR